jgi:hypothetical protein
MAAKLLWVSILLVIALQSASWADSTSLAIKLNVATAPSTGLAGVTKVNVTGSGFSSATITPANITVSLATSCGGVVSASTPALSTKTVVGSSRVVQFQIPGTLAPNTYFVSIKGTDSTGALFASSNCSQIAITTGNPITTCRDITASGNYFLARDLLETQAMTTCLRIHDTRNVQLDCKFKAITGAGSPAISVTNVQGFAITNCTLQTTAVGGNTRVLEATTSSNGILTRNTIGNLTDQQHFIVYFTSVNNTGLINNTIDAELIQIRSSGNILRSNTLTCPVWMNNATCGGLIYSVLGSNNTMDGNQIDGKGGPSTGQNGADDGILVADESGDILSNNAIRNTWDMGIETVGNIANMQITSNSIASVGVGGIGGWYWNSWSNVTTTNNSVSNAPQLFTLFRIYGLRAQNWDGNGVAGDAAVYFQGNLFSGNRLTNVSVQAMPSAYIPIYNYLNYHNTVSGIPGERIAQKSDFKLNNNTFTQNDFGRIQPPPDFSAPFTTGEIIDGGGNICASPGANYPLVCN